MKVDIELNGIKRRKIKAWFRTTLRWKLRSIQLELCMKADERLCGNLPKVNTEDTANRLFDIGSAKVSLSNTHRGPFIVLKAVK